MIWLINFVFRIARIDFAFKAFIDHANSLHASILSVSRDCIMQQPYVSPKDVFSSFDGMDLLRHKTCMMHPFLK